MAGSADRRNIQTRANLFDFLQSQMQTAYRDLKEKQRLESESTLIKSYLFEVDLPKELVGSKVNEDKLREFVEGIFGEREHKESRVEVKPREETGFFEIYCSMRGREMFLYLDTATNPRFWEGFSISKSTNLDTWFYNVVSTRSEFDFVWLWPAFLEKIQKRGRPRGFGLDYDYRKFESGEEEATTYLKMQIWGGSETEDLYKHLRSHHQFRNKIVLSKIRMKEFGDSSSQDEFAIQDVKYTGKFTTRGTSFATHARTLSLVRSEYEDKIQFLEDSYSLRWKEGKKGEVILEGFAIHFIPEGFELPVKHFCDCVFDGSLPFRLMGFVDYLNDTSAVADVVDMHSGGKLSFEIYPDILSVYLPEGTCGNSIARFYTNLQHFFDVRFTVEADNGDKLF